MITLEQIEMILRDALDEVGVDRDAVDNLDELGMSLNDLDEFENFVRVKLGVYLPRPFFYTRANRDIPRLAELIHEFITK